MISHMVKFATYWDFLVSYYCFTFSGLCCYACTRNRCIFMFLFLISCSCLTPCFVCSLYLCICWMIYEWIIFWQLLFRVCKLYL